jgi:glycosyltransferase involved in cell wall biosynthesis
MRILHLGKYFPPARGGMERFLGDLVAAQRAAGDEPAVLAHADPSSERIVDPPGILRCPVWLRLFFAPLSPLYVLWLRRAIRRFRPEILHIHMPNVSPFWALLLPSARRIPWVVQWQSDVEPSRFKLSLRLLYPYYRIFERALLERAEAIVVASPQYLDASAPLRPWRSKCRVIPLGIDPARLPEADAAKAAPYWKGGALRLLAAGRLTYYKGFDMLIRAVAPEPSLQLVIAGAGEEYPRLDRTIVRAGAVDRIRLVGGIDDATLHALMATCDAFCLPSVERTEAFGIVLLEAMRYGRALVASDLAGSGVTYVARQGQNAVLLPPGDTSAWREGLQSLAEHPRGLVLMGRLGRERCLHEFDIASVARRIRLLYSLVLRVSAEDAGARDAIEGRATAAVARDDPAPVAASNGRLLVVIPALDEAACIAEIVAKARAQPDIDVAVIDDGSTDDTAALALLSGAIVLRAPLWQGAWGAIQTGIRYAVRAGYAGVVSMDADGQHEPAHLPQLIEAARHADVVIAACPSRGSRLRRVAWSYFRLLTGFTLDDLTSGFRYYNARACRLLAGEEATLLDYQDIGVLLLLRHARLRIAEIPVAMNPRRSGASRVFFSWWTVARYMGETTLLCLARWNPPARRR